MYFRINAAGLNDPRWNADHFSVQRVDAVFAVLKFLEKHDIARYNAASLATAKLGSVVVSALAGKKSRVTPDDFLPFDTRKINKESGVTTESIGVLCHLMKTRRLDDRLVAMLVDELKSASLRETD